MSCFSKVYFCCNHHSCLCYRVTRPLQIHFKFSKATKRIVFKTILAPSHMPIDDHKTVVDHFTTIFFCTSSYYPHCCSFMEHFPSPTLGVWLCFNHPCPENSLALMAVMWCLTSVQMAKKNHEEMLSITGQKGSANQNCIKIPSHSC
jgi:hypothetical protein